MVTRKNRSKKFLCFKNMHYVLPWISFFLLPQKLSADFTLSLDNYVNPLWARMYSLREWEDVHVFSTSTKHYPPTWVEVHAGYTLTFQMPPSTMEISFPTFYIDPDMMNRSESVQQDSEEVLRQYMHFRRKFTLPDDVIPKTTIGDLSLASGLDKSIRQNIQEYLARRYHSSTLRSVHTTMAILGTTQKAKKRRGRKTTEIKKPVARGKTSKKRNNELSEPYGEREGEYEEELEENELDKLENLSKMDTEELLKEERKMKAIEEKAREEKEGKVKEKPKKNVDILLRDYDDTNKTGLKYKHKEYMKKGYYFRDESAQFIHGSREYLPKIVSNHSNLNRFIEKMQQQPAGKKGLKTGYKYRKERFQQSGYEYRDEAGKFYQKNMQDSKDVQNYDTGFRFKDTLLNHSEGNMKAMHRMREGTQFKKGFGMAKDYEHKFQDEYENYQDSRSQYKRKQEVHRIEKRVSKKKMENQRIHYEMKNEQCARPNGSQLIIDHFDYDKIELGHTAKRRQPLTHRHYIPHELAGRGFDYVNQDVTERRNNLSYVMRQQRGRVKILSNGSVEWLHGGNSSVPNRLPVPVPLDSNELVPDASRIGSQIHSNETGFHIRDEAFENDAARNYKYNKSIGRFYSKLGPPGPPGYRDIVFKYLDTRHRNQEGYRKIDRKGHILTREKLANVSSESKKAYNLVHEKLVQPNFKMVNEKGYIQEMRDYEDYMEKKFTHYLKSFKSKHLKFTEQYNQILNMKKQVSNNTKLNISYSRLMRKSYDRVQYRAANETWSLPWHDQLFYTMAPEMNYVPLLGTMEPQQDFLPESDHTTFSAPEDPVLGRESFAPDDTFLLGREPLAPDDPFLLGRQPSRSNRSMYDYTYEKSDYETVDPQFLDSKGNWIYPDSKDMPLPTNSSMPSEEVARIAASFNGTRENRAFNYIDWKTCELTDEPPTTHICQMIYNPDEKKMEYCKHPSHQLTCHECNKTFKGWFEYNLHQQAVNRKLKKYIFEEEGLFNDLVSFQANNATLRAGLEDANPLQVVRKSTRPGDPARRNFMPYENFNPLHLDAPRPEDTFERFSKETPISSASEGDLYDSIAAMDTLEEITRPDFNFMYRRNRSIEDSGFAYQNYSDETPEKDSISVMKLAHKDLYKDIVY